VSGVLSGLSIPGAAAAYLVFGVALGVLTDWLLAAVLGGRARSRQWRMGAAAIRALRGLPTALGVVLGAAAAVQRIGLSAEMRHTASTGVRIAAILVITAFSARVLGRLVRAITARDDVPLPSGSILVHLAQGVVWALGAMSLLATAGVSVAPLLTALGVGGLAMGLALQPTLENVFSGIQLLASRQIKPGDFIRLDNGEEGTVLDVTWRNTSVRKPSNDIVIVPNSILARASVTNFSSVDPEFVLVIPVSFASSADPDLVERVALEVAHEVVAECPEAAVGHEPGARFASLTPPAAVINVTIWCRSYQERIPIRHEVVRRLAKRFAEEEIGAPPALPPTAGRV